MNEVTDYTAANNALPKIPFQYSKFPFETIFFFTLEPERSV